MRRIKPRKDINTYLIFLLSLLSLLFLIIIDPKPGLAQQTINKIAFVANLDKNWDIFVYTFFSNNSAIQQDTNQALNIPHKPSPHITRITNTPYDEKEPSLSPDGNTLTYATTDGLIHTIDLVTKKQTQLKLEIAKSKFIHPSFSPDGNKIILAHFKNNKIDNSDLAIYDLENEKLHPFLNQLSTQLYPVWSPSGECIAYINLHCGLECGRIIQELWIAEANGQHARQLLLTNSHCMHPAWSPDGQKIAFSSDIKGNFDIFVFHPKDKTMEQITTHKSLDDTPTWSPDGKKIAFISTRTGTMAIWIKDLQTGKIIKLKPFLDDTIACKDIVWH